MSNSTTQELRKEQAIALYSSGFWKDMSFRERAMFQLFEPRLCMPFDVFHEALKKTLGRGVLIREFDLNIAGLRQELLGKAPTPSFAEVINLIPADKRMTIHIRKST